jgi:uncharacterized repeat protein (TIGR01451 family)
VAAAAGTADSWSELVSLPTPRRLLAAAADGGRIYTFGGCGSPCFEPPLHTDTFEETRVEVYDLATGVWSARPPIPAILFGAAAAAPGNGRIYTFGGYLTGNLVLEYDPATSNWAAKSPIPTPRHGLAAVALGGKVYALGGSGPSGALEVYDPATDRWSRRAPMPTARVFLAAAELGGKIYALGGSPDAEGGSQSAAVEVYDPATDSWAAGAPLPVAEQLSAAVAVNGKIYAFGGFVPGAGVRNATYEYDPAANRWATRAPMPVARDQAPAVLAADGLAYVLGGSTDCHCRAIGTAESYKPRSTSPPVPCVSLTKTDHRTTAAPGDTTSYRIRVANCSTAAEAVTVSDPFDGTGLLGGLWCQGAGCLPSVPGDLLDTVTVPAGAAVLYTIAGTVPCGPGPGPSSLVNTACATVAGLPPVCHADADTVAPPTADLEIAGTASPTTIAGETVSYHWAVQNLGPCPAQAVVLEQPLGALLPAAPPPGSARTIQPPAHPRPGAGRTAPLSPGAGSTGGAVPCAASSGVLRCQLGTLAAGGAVPVDVQLGVPCELPAGSLPATATVTSPTPDTSPGDDSATVTTAISVVAYSIVKSCPALAVAAGTIDYTLTVANAGPSCPSAAVSDVLPPQVGSVLWCRGAPCTPKLPGSVSDRITLSPGGVEAYSVEGTIDGAFSGLLPNTATVATLAGSDPVLPYNSSTCTTYVKPPPPNGVTGSCNVSGPFVEGGTVTYTYVLTNVGSQAQPDNPGPEFTDALPAGLTLLGATADSGTVTTAASSVSWNGSIPGGGGTVTILVTATIGAGTAGATLCNQGTFFFVLDGKETSAETVGPCCLEVPRPGEVPALSEGALATLALLLAALAVARLGGRELRR